VIAIRRAVAWHERARAGTLPTRVTNGSPRLWQCHYCEASSTDAEALFQHVMAHPQVDRRRAPRVGDHEAEAVAEAVANGGTGEAVRDWFAHDNRQRVEIDLS
jgi:hypothetical protein